MKSPSYNPSAFSESFDYIESELTSSSSPDSKPWHVRLHHCDRAMNVLNITGLMGEIKPGNTFLARQIERKLFETSNSLMEYQQGVSDKLAQFQNLLSDSARYAMNHKKYWTTALFVPDVVKDWHKEVCETRRVASIEHIMSGAEISPEIIARARITEAMMMERATDVQDYLKMVWGKTLENIPVAVSDKVPEPVKMEVPVPNKAPVPNKVPIAVPNKAPTPETKPEPKKPLEISPTIKKMLMTQLTKAVASRVSDFPSFARKTEAFVFQTSETPEEYYQLMVEKIERAEARFGGSAPEGSPPEAEEPKAEESKAEKKAVQANTGVVEQGEALGEKGENQVETPKLDLHREPVKDQKLLKSPAKLPAKPQKSSLQKKVSILEARVEKLEKSRIFDIFSRIKSIELPDKRLLGTILYFSWTLALLYLLPSILFPLFLSILIAASLLFCAMDPKPICAAWNVVKPWLKTVYRKIRHHPNTPLISVYIIAVFWLIFNIYAPSKFRIYASVLLANISIFGAGLALLKLHLDSLH